MQRVLDLLKDEEPTPEPGQPAWVLGRRYDIPGDTWSEAFLTDVHRRIWLMYRTRFATAIPRHPDGPSPLLQNMNAFLRAGPYSVPASSIAGSFTSDVGWGCMIRTGQSLLANALLKLLTESDAQIPSQTMDSEDELKLLRKFSDDPQAAYSIHKFVDYGAAKCGKLPGQWFGPSAVAACIANFAETPLHVYVSSGMDVFEQDLLALGFPVLVLSGLRLGIQEVNPVYYEGLQNLLASKQSVGIAGGRTSASHYFYGFQGTRLFYHDPHEPKPALSADSPDADFVQSMHSRRLRALNFSDMDPSMLAGFLLTSEGDYEEWKAGINVLPLSARVINISTTKPVADFVDDMSDSESLAEEDLSIPKAAGASEAPRERPGADKEVRSIHESPRTSQPPPDQVPTDQPPLGRGSDERIAQESLVTIDRTEPADESTVEVTKLRQLHLKPVGNPQIVSQEIDSKGAT